MADALGHGDLKSDGDGSDGESSDEEEMRANDCLCAWCDDGGVFCEHVLHACSLSRLSQLCMAVACRHLS